MFETDERRAVFTVAFACRECGGEFCRMVPRDPESVWRCLPCEAVYVRTVSDRLLAQVYSQQIEDTQH